MYYIYTPVYSYTNRLLQLSLLDSDGDGFIWFEDCPLKQSNGVLVSGKGESGDELSEENVYLQLS